MPTSKTRKFGDFLIKRTLGHGGIGTVYLAERAASGEEVALKVLPKSAAANGEYSRQFLTEARIASRLDHPNIVKVLGYGRQEGRYYMAMDYVEGESCKARISRERKLDWQAAIGICIQVAEGLAAAAKEGIIHRDIKPENILLDKTGLVRVADLGLAKEVGRSEPLPSDTSLGTPDYMSPEQVNNSETVDLRSDIYSLGATLFHMICGKAPFTGRSAYEVMVKHVSADLPSPLKYVPELPLPVRDVMRKMMARDPEDRYQDYAQLLHELRALLAGQPVVAEEFDDASMLSDNGLHPAHAARTHRRLWLALAAVPIVAALLCLVYVIASP